ncbi:hypothetical protein [Streptomyces sp. 8N616]|uniref:hypothetical protein n=1 Tax=Streptomyces sp. 8N616 TaxID=3457414 RepID=UPI003FD56A45
MVSGRGYKLVAGTFLGNGSGPQYDELRDRPSRRPVAETRSVGPRDVWRHHIRLRLVLGLLTGVAVALFFGSLAAYEYGLRNGVLVSALRGCGHASSPARSATWALPLPSPPSSSPSGEGTPVRLMSFLENARRRNLLRAAGPAYQFRHTRLQERLTDSARPEG